LPELQIKANLGYTNIYSKALTKTPISSYNPAIAAFVQNQSAFSNTTYKALIIEPQLSWSKRVERHSFDILAGMTFQNDVRDGIAESATGFSSEALMDNIKAANNILIAAYNYSKYKYSAFFGRFNYDYKKKYLVNITARRDGSSRFGPGKQFANFGAIGVGWIFSSEEWLNKYLSVLSFGKLRASLGTTGNDQIGDYAFLDTYSPSGQYQGVNGLNPSRLFNPDFAWETSKKMEVAFELGFLRDRIMLNVNYYRNKSSNQLVGYPLAPTTGFSSVQYNLPATIENTGVEFELSTVNINSKKVTWKSSINITIPRNKLIEFPNLSGSSFANQYVVGQSLNIKKVYRSLGVDKQTGVYTFEDVDKNNILNSVDQQTTKFVGQNFYGGLANTFKYNKLQIDIMFQFVKQTGNNYLVTGFTLPGTAGNKPVFVLDDHWKKPNDAATIQRFTAGNYAPAYSNRSYLLNSDLSITDASFIRLKNLSISYDIDRQTFSKFPLQLMKLFIQCQNLITITGYKGLDPENQNATRLPPLRVLTAGVQVIL
jgi:TonB-linked SusC/RagA family outer membrane protein